LAGGNAATAHEVSFEETIELVGKAVDVAGVVVIVAGILIASTLFAVRGARSSFSQDVYRGYRQGIGRAILLGLELLVAADIIRTVAVAPTFRSVGVLALIVLVRTFLSFTLEVELGGRWPWQRRTQASS
jgi:uncharacterized membrane protein